jgi:hypothetical protein
MAFLLLTFACGGDDPQPQIGAGPADDIEGGWRGNYIAADGSQSGTLCLDIEQNERGITGRIRFNDGDPVEIGGVITESKFLITWGSALEGSLDSNTPVDIAVGGGTLNGDSGEEAISGTWISAATADVHGEWNAERLSQFETCD